MKLIAQIITFVFIGCGASFAAPPTSFEPVLKAKNQRPGKVPAGAPAADNFLRNLEKIANALLGKPYANGPLGEASHDAFDPDPLYRLDTFDCTTFLETVLANAFCSNSSHQEKCIELKMQDLRYQGKEISFRTRNHIPELDWLPNNVRKGYLRDVSAEILPGEAKTLAYNFAREQWLREQTKKVDLAKLTAPEQAIRLSYLPIGLFFEERQLSPAEKQQIETKHQEKLAEAAKTQAQGKDIPIDAEDDPAIDKFRTEMENLKEMYVPIDDKLRAIPAGSILNLVRGRSNPKGKRPSTLTMISHQGLILHIDGVPYIFHAAPNVKHVSKQRLSDYLIRYLKSAKARGISIYQIVKSK